eukprot:jgi/Tetstr1/439159/TSEL_027610.t2
MLEGSAPHLAEAHRLGVLRQIQAAMRNHSGGHGGAAAMQHVCYALRVLVADGSGAAQAGRLGVLVDLQAVMRSHPGSGGIQLEALAALPSLTATTAGKAVARELHLLQDVQRALGLFAGSGAVQARVAAAVRGMSGGDIAVMEGPAEADAGQSSASCI